MKNGQNNRVKNTRNHRSERTGTMMLANENKVTKFRRKQKAEGPQTALIESYTEQTKKGTTNE